MVVKLEFYIRLRQWRKSVLRSGGGGDDRILALRFFARACTHIPRHRHMAKGSILKNLVPRKTGLKIRYLP